ncbi:MAG: methyltransferase domain-containing protein [Pseudomonadota bacterium]|nr:methyltransferase domain-containing protein [Pseudomonadota bacterium]
MDFSAELKHTIRRMYDTAARKPDGLLSQVALNRGRELLTSLGYQATDIDSVPESIIQSAFPCGNPLPIIRKLQPKNILDLGCGSCLDIGIMAADQNHQQQLIIGVDFSRELLSLGSRFISLSSANHIRLLTADLTDLPFSGPHFDCINLNGSFNVIYDKATFLKQISALLHPDGHVLINDLLLVEELPAGFTDDIINWTWNVAGALPPEELEKLAGEAGLALVHFHDHERLAPVCRGEILLQKRNSTF